jgi:ketosteroid isomerase-like protein
LSGILAALAAVVALAASPVPSAAPGTEIADIARLETAWNEAHQKGDAAVLESLWADDLVVTVPNMAVITRDAAVAVVRSGRMKFRRYETSDVSIRVYGGAAVVTGRLQRTRDVGDRVLDDDWRFTKVYVRRDGRWQVVAFQASDTPPAQGAPPVTTDRDEINRAIADFIEAYNSGDAERVIACYGDDLVKVRAGAPPENKAEAARRIKDVLARFQGHLTVQNDEITVAGDMAFTRGSLSITLVPRDGSGPAQTIERRFLEVWRKESGRWRVVRTMDNAR